MPLASFLFWAERVPITKVKSSNSNIFSAEKKRNGKRSNKRRNLVWVSELAKEIEDEPVDDGKDETENDISPKSAVTTIGSKKRSNTHKGKDNTDKGIGKLLIE